MSDYITGRTYTPADFDSPDAFWDWVKGYEHNRPIRLQTRDGGITGPFVGASDVTGLAYAPEPDGMASLARPGSDSLNNVLRRDIVAVTVL